MERGIKMEFDKNKILTCVTADQAKVGQKGWFANDLETLEAKAIYYSPHKLYEILSEANNLRFKKETLTLWALFYPAPEPTYAERQAEWVKENNVKEGTKVRFIKGFDDNEDGSDCCEHEDAKGIEGIVESITRMYIFVFIPAVGGWTAPFTTLEVIKEQAYRPFANAEEFKPYRDEWFRVKNGGGFDSVRYYDNNGVKDSTGNFITYQKLFEAGERENGDPCGVKEEA
jgi:hypothetical protein